MNLKSAEAMRTTENDPQKKLDELHADPEGRPVAGTLDATWGEAPHKDPTHNGEAAWNEFLNDSPKLLDKAFDGFKATATGDKSLIGAYFSTKDYTARSPLLRKYAEAGNIPSDATLGERVQSLVGRR